MGERNISKEMEKVKGLLESDPNYIHSKKFEFSLQKAIARYPNGCPNKVIASSLMLKEEEIDELYQVIVLKLREQLKVE